MEEAIRKLEKMIENPSRADKIVYTRGDIEDAIEGINRLKDRIKELEEENRRLSEKNKIYSNALVQEKEEKKKLKEERDELDRVNHNLNAKISDLYDVEQILRDIVININRLDKLKKIVFKYDAKQED